MSKKIKTTTIKGKTKQEKYIDEKTGKVKKKTVFVNDPLIVPKKKNKLLCIILCENKTNFWLWRSKKDDQFTFKGNLYFILDTYRAGNGIEFCLYLEGVSTPITHKHIQKERVQKTITSPITGKPETHFIDVIKGLKFDSKILYMLLNRGLFKELTKTYIDVPNLLIMLLLAVVAVLGIINIIIASGVING